MAHAEVQSLGVYKFVLNWLSIMWLKKVRYQPEAEAAQFRLTTVSRRNRSQSISFKPQAWQALNSARLKQGNLDLVPQEQQETHRERLIGCSMKSTSGTDVAR